MRDIRVQNFIYHRPKLEPLTRIEERKVEDDPREDATFLEESVLSLYVHNSNLPGDQGKSDMLKGLHNYAQVLAKINT